MEHTHAAHGEAHEPHGIRRSGAFILSGISGGHGVFHWFANSFLVMLPKVQEHFGLTGLEYGAISSTREVVSGLVALPGGVVTDMVRRHWGAVLAGCMALFGLGWLVMGLSPVYPLLLVGMAMVAMASSAWHLPGMAALSHHFSHRRGSVFAFHGAGGQIGDVAGPALTGVLLGVLVWQEILWIYAALPLFLTFVVFWAFRDIGKTAEEAAPSPDLQYQMAQTRRIFKIKRLWGVILVAALRGMAFVSFMFFLPLYLTQELNLSDRSLGLHIALLLVVGIISTPIMGYLSDRLGRKLLLIPGLISLCVLVALLVPFGQGALLLIMLAVTGMFLFSDQPILTAAAMDIVGDGVTATTLGVISFSRFAFSAASPLIAGLLYGVNIDFVFYYVASLFALATVVLLAIPLKASNRASTTEATGHHHSPAGAG
jgi:MFS family permease